MGKVRRAVGVALLLGLVGMTGVGCGDDEGNDQGISFRAVGIFQGEESDGECQVPTATDAIADAGISVPLDGMVFDSDGVFFPVLEGGFPDSSVGFSTCRAYIQLQNDLINQSINVERIDFEYEIPGARLAVPMNSMPTGFRIQPKPLPPEPETTEPEPPPSPFGQVNVVFIQPNGQLVPSTLVQFLRQNEPSLPQLPYVMIIHITAHGRTDTGDTLVSNELRYTFEWTS